MIQFIKGPWKSGEDESYKRLMPELEIRKMGLGFVGILGDTLPRAKHKEAAAHALTTFEKELKSKKWALIVLDEVNVAVGLKIISASAVLKAVKKTPLETFVILTGRDAPASFLKAADLATEMREIKHPFNKGELAKVALDF
jgi:cob(I)alamin adenosyltransferase